VVDAEVARAAAAGVPPERVVIGGFSQGACLALEYAARHARRWGGVIAFTGGLIGPDDTPRDYVGDFDGTPVLLGTSDPDPHVPVERARHTASVLEGMGARVDLRIYPGLGHTVNREELDAARALLAAVAGGR
jgi:predicted esterase